MGVSLLQALVKATSNSVRRQSHRLTKRRQIFATTNRRASRQDAWVGLLREMGTSDRDAVVFSFRAIRGLLAQYDGWR